MCECVGLSVYLMCVYVSTCVCGRLFVCTKCVCVCVCVCLCVTNVCVSACVCLHQYNVYLWRVCLCTSNVYVLVCAEGEPATTGGQHASGAGER